MAKTRSHKVATWLFRLRLENVFKEKGLDKTLFVTLSDKTAMPFDGTIMNVETKKVFPFKISDSKRHFYGGKRSGEKFYYGLFGMYGLDTFRVCFHVLCLHQYGRGDQYLMFNDYEVKKSMSEEVKGPFISVRYDLKENTIQGMGGFKSNGDLSSKLMPQMIDEYVSMWMS